jgi:ABC-type transport system involved in multi-copper enzyme maturation permease subunit
MSSVIVKRLIVKDWYLQRWTITGYLAAGVLSILFLGTGGSGSFYAGVTVLVTALIGFSIHLTMATIVNERTEHTLPFIMTLPVSNRDYTAAKVASNLTMFLLPWSALTVAVLAVLNGRGAETRQLIPWATLILVELFAAYCLLLFVSLATESQAWTIGVMVAANLFFQAFLYLVSHTPSIAAGMKSHRIEWSNAAVMLLLIELSVIVLLLALTFAVRARKSDLL